MRSMTLPKVNISLETMRRLYRMAYAGMGLFVNLEAMEGGTLSSRLIEYPFVLQKLDGQPRGRVLDVGCTASDNIVAPTLAALGWQVYGVDTREFKFKHPNFRFVREDIRKTSFPDGFFDWICAVSTIEHIGLAGRYSVKVDDWDGDFKAVAEVRRLLRPGGRFLITLPYGQGGVVKPAERVYERCRLRRLLEGWSVEEETYYYLDNGGEWHQVPEEVAGRTRTPGGVAIALLELTCA